MIDPTRTIVTTPPALPGRGDDHNNTAAHGNRYRAPGHSHVHPSGPVNDADRGARPGRTPGSIQTLLDQANSLLPQRPGAVLPPRPEVLMRPGQGQRDTLRAAMKQLVTYERVLGISQPPIDPKMPLPAQFANIDKRYNAVRHELDRAARGDRELPRAINAARVREVLDLAKARLDGVGFTSSFTNSGHIKHADSGHTEHSG